VKQDRSHDDLVTQFGSYYAGAGSPPLRELEQRVFGSDYGGNGYTNTDDARHLARLMHLDSTSTLLDIGTGAGWPGLFLAKESGCHVVLTDMPFDGLHVAHHRAMEENIDGQAVRADGTYLPFRKTSFDAVTHSDVLC
jgi:2-polyprenyl-3-methyl-5-hydroxy-6-metoxy-1,4-benzoquinol methylase